MVEEIARSYNHAIMTNGYPIFKWDPGVTILNDDEDENEIADSMERVAYDMHAEPDNKDDGDDEDENILAKMTKVTVMMTMMAFITQTNRRENPKSIRYSRQI